MLNQYIPKIIVVGNKEQLIAAVTSANKPVQIIGTILLKGQLEDEPYDLNQHTILFDNSIIDIKELKTMSDDGKFDYIVFVDHFYFNMFAFALMDISELHIDQIIMMDTLIGKVDNFFVSGMNEMLIFNLAYSNDVKTILDVDSLFANNIFYTKPNGLEYIKIEGISSKKYKSFPIYKNIYDKVYDSYTECRLQYYDMIVLTAEISLEELMVKVNALINQSNMFLIFIRTEINLDSVIAGITSNNEFSSVKFVPATNGKWLMFIKTDPKESQEDISIYVVTHKEFTVDYLPENYNIIQAGRKLHEDLGYIGDDTGQSISELNIYLNEMTAAYWIWKNTTHDYVGLVHYRRFFSDLDSKDFDTDHIIKTDKAIEMLKDSDIIVAKGEIHIYNQYNYIVNDVGPFVARLAVNLARSALERHHPDYIDAFDLVFCSNNVFKCNMFISRKYVFDSYCEWLFPFLLEAESIFRKLINIDILPFKQKRIFGFICERMFNVWIIKNNLRIKELFIMENLD